jgi:SAM-dependent methyltransferase
VLEVGAGLGVNTALLRSGQESRWVCLEPDPKLVTRLKETTSASAHGTACEVVTGTIDSLPADQKFDTVLYIDVLEHIDGDRDEIRRAASRLKSGGRLIVLSPAHGWLYSPFDEAIGHCRRYTVRMLTRLTAANMRVARAFYLDSVGLLASAANRLLLKQSMPKAGQLRFWDNCMVPCSRVLDAITAYRLGKTVVCIWEHN